MAEDLIIVPPEHDAFIKSGINAPDGHCFAVQAFTPQGWKYIDNALELTDNPDKARTSEYGAPITYDDYRYITRMRLVNDFRTVAIRTTK